MYCTVNVLKAFTQDTLKPPFASKTIELPESFFLLGVQPNI
jgi:hypothetical protein